MKNRDIGMSRASGLARGQIIRQLRLQEKVPAVELAKRLDVAQSLIALMESGQIPVSEEMVQRVHEALKVEKVQAKPENVEALKEEAAELLAQNAIMKAKAKVKSWRTKP